MEDLKISADEPIESWITKFNGLVDKVNELSNSSEETAETLKSVFSNRKKKGD